MMTECNDKPGSGANGVNGVSGVATLTHTHANAREGEGNAGTVMGLDFDSDLEYVPDGETQNDGSDPVVPLPYFLHDKGDWPEIIDLIVNKGRTRAQRDILLLGALDVIGATLGPKVRTLYDGKWLSPCMMLFVVAPPASGKGVLAWLRPIVQPFHDELKRKFEEETRAYKREKMKFDSLGKARASQPDILPPEPPVRRFFIIPGNNSGTGMQANLINSGGRGIIFHTEADTLTAALNTDYGHFDDALRNTFDHEGLYFYRRTGDESREVDSTYLSVLLSGTPDQVKRLIPSYANGLASRFTWYYMPPVKQWQSQFDRKDDVTAWFRSLGRKWKLSVDRLNGVNHFTFALTRNQQEIFDIFMSTIFLRGQNAIGIESVSTAIRLAPQMLRIMSVVAFLRNMETGEGMVPADDVPPENVRDGICPHYTYGINEDDFMNCLHMSDTLFRHAMHVLSLLPPVEVTNRGSSDRELLFSYMKETFTRHEYLDKAGEMGISENTAQQWLKNALKKHLIVKVNHGTYRFVNFAI